MVTITTAHFICLIPVLSHFSQSYTFKIIRFIWVFCYFFRISAFRNQIYAYASIYRLYFEFATKTSTTPIIYHDLISKCYDSMETRSIKLLKKLIILSRRGVTIKFYNENNFKFVFQLL